MYKNFLINEFRKLLRDPMLRFISLYLLLMGALGRYVIPNLAETNGFMIEPIADYFVVGLTLMTPTIYGALLAFSVLDDRDDNILTSIKVTPLSVHKFLSFRLALITVMTFFGMCFCDVVC